MKNGFKVVFVIIGTIIGAGFASGQEIFLFFNSFGVYGLIGIVLSAFITSFIIYKLIRICQVYSISTYDEFLNQLLGRNKFLKWFVSLLINLFLLITFYIMVAGFGAYFFQELNTSKLIGSFLIIAMCYIIFKKKTSGLVKANELLVPGLIILIFLLGLKCTGIFSIHSFTASTQTHLIGNWLISSIIYASYNSIILIPMLITLKDFLKTKKQASFVSISCGFIIAILGLLISISIATIGSQIEVIELPTVYVASRFGSFYQYLYGIVILIAIFTSAIAAGYGFLNNWSNSEKEYQYLLIFMCITALFVSNIGFSNLVTILYPLFGYLGLVQILLALKTKT